MGQIKDESKRLVDFQAFGGVIERGFDLKLGEPRVWSPQPGLKDLLLRDNQPLNEVYRRLLRLWPDISESRLREILVKVDRERLEKIVKLCELTGKSPTFFEEFLGSECDYKRLDAILRYYLYVLPRIESFMSKLDENLSVSWRYDIDGGKYEGRLYLLFDGEQIKLEVFRNKFNQPVIGSRYETWPCFRVIEARLNALKEICLNSRETLLELLNLKERYDDLKNSFYRLDPLSFGISFPVKYVKTLGHIKKRYLYANIFSIGCAFCPQRKHEITLIAILEERKRAGEVEA